MSKHRSHGGGGGGMSFGPLFSIIGGLVGLAVVLIGAGFIIPALWPTIATSGADIATMTYTTNATALTDPGTKMIQSGWTLAPIFGGLAIFVLLVVGVLSFMRSKRSA